MCDVNVISSILLIIAFIVDLPGKFHTAVVQISWRCTVFACSNYKIINRACSVSCWRRLLNCALKVALCLKLAG